MIALCSKNDSSVNAARPVYSGQVKRMVLYSMFITARKLHQFFLEKNEVVEAMPIRECAAGW